MNDNSCINNDKMKRYQSALKDQKMILKGKSLSIKLNIYLADVKKVLLIKNKFPERFQSQNHSPIRFDK